jgi:hypothetical protein
MQHFFVNLQSRQDIEWVSIGKFGENLAKNCKVIKTHLRRGIVAFVLCVRISHVIESYDD